MLELAELNAPTDSVLFAKFNVPLVNVYVCVDVKAPLSATVPPVPDWVMGFKVLPADVIVAVPEVLANVNTPVPVVNVMPATNVSEP